MSAGAQTETQTSTEELERCPRQGDDTQQDPQIARKLRSRLQNFSKQDKIPGLQSETRVKSITVASNHRDGQTLASHGAW